jgi:hypothetical protein
MTDHSILTPGFPDFPFKREAQLVTRIYKFIAVTAPSALAVAIEARNLVDALNGLNDNQLAGLGIERTGIAAYAATKTGLLGR